LSSRPALLCEHECRDDLIRRRKEIHPSRLAWDRPVDPLDLARSSGQQVEQYRRTGAGNRQPELADVRGGVLDRDRHADRARNLEGFLGTPSRDRPGVRVVDQLADRELEETAGAAEGGVADPLLPADLPDI